MNTNKFTCDNCLKSFTTKNGLLLHKDKKKPCVKAVIEPIIDSSIVIPAVLPTTESNDLKCEYCDKKYVSLKTLTTHKNKCSLKKVGKVQEEVKMDEKEKEEVHEEEVQEEEEEEEEVKEEEVKEEVKVTEVKKKITFDCEYCNRKFDSRKGQGIHMGRCPKKPKPQPRPKQQQRPQQQQQQRPSQQQQMPQAPQLQPPQGRLQQQIHDLLQNPNLLPIQKTQLQRAQQVVQQYKIGQPKEEELDESIEETNSWIREGKVTMDVVRKSPNSNDVNVNINPGTYLSDLVDIPDDLGIADNEELIEALDYLFKKNKIIVDIKDVFKAVSEKLKNENVAQKLREQAREIMRQEEQDSFLRKYKEMVEYKKRKIAYNLMTRRENGDTRPEDIIEREFVRKMRRRERDSNIREEAEDVISRREYNEDRRKYKRIIKIEENIYYKQLAGDKRSDKEITDDFQEELERLENAERKEEEEAEAEIKKSFDRCRERGNRCLLVEELADAKIMAGDTRDLYDIEEELDAELKEKDTQGIIVESKEEALLKEEYKREEEEYRRLITESRLID